MLTSITDKLRKIIAQKFSICHIIIFIIITIFFQYSINNINHFPIPNSDTYQYINDGNYYVKFKLPKNFQTPPLYPTALILLSKIISLEYKEIVAGHLINIFSSTFILFNIYLLLKKKSIFLSAIVIFLLATNKIFMANTLNIGSELPGLLLISFSLLLYKNNKINFSIFIASLIFFIRYDYGIFGIILIATDYLLKINKFKLKHFLIIIFPIIIWTSMLTIHNNKNKDVQMTKSNHLIEIKDNFNLLPNKEFAVKLIQTVIFDPLEVRFDIKNIIIKENINYFNYLFFIILIYLTFSFLKHNKSQFYISLLIIFSTAHLLILFIFPNFTLRYLLPTIISVYILFVFYKNKILRIIFILILLTYNILNINKNSITHDRPILKAEYRLIADWINKQHFEKKTIIYFFDPGTAMYYVNNNTNIIISTDSYEDNSKVFTICNNDIVCVIKKSKYNSDQYDNIFITQSTTTIPPETIFAPHTQVKLHHITAFHQDKIDQSNNFKIITTLGNKDSWVNIYKYVE